MCQAARKQRGISGVDVAVIVACFSVVAMLAVPRHLNISAEARRVEVQSLAANVESATQAAHAIWKARGRPPVLRLGSGDVAMVHGFPSAATIESALGAPETHAFIFDGGRWRHRDTRRDGCSVSYQPPDQMGDNPVLTVTQSSC